VIALLASGVEIPASPPSGFPAPGTEIFDYTKSCLVGSGPYCLTKISLLMIISMVVIIAFFVTAFRKAQLVPTSRSQRYAEGIVDIVRKGVILEVMGPEGLKYLPFLFSIFIFIWVNNFYEVLPFAQIPTTSRIAIPMFLAILVWFVFNIEGIRAQGGWHYLKSVLFPPGVPWPIYFLVTPIEFVSVFLVRPLTLAVRLAANMLAGHTMLKVFAGFIVTMLSAGGVLAYLSIAPLLAGIAVTALEFLVAAIQAWVFALLTCIYLNEAVHLHEH